MKAPRNRRIATLPQNLVPIAFVGIVMILMVVMLVTLISTGQLNSSIAVGIIAFSSSVILAFLYFFIRLVRAQKETVTLALLGVRGSGKTVYATMLFSELRSYTEGRLSFRPYGSETRQRVAEYKLMLQSQEWPPRTTTATVFHYMAEATLRHSWFRKEYKVILPDYEGEDTENIAELESLREAYRSDFFRQVVASDGVLLLLDCEFLVSASEVEIKKFENAMISAVEELMEQKGVPGSRQMSAPLAVVFIKSDVLPESEDLDSTEGRLPELIAFCLRASKETRVFRASAVGALAKDGRPSKNLQPDGIVEPVVWLISRIGRISV